MAVGLPFAAMTAMLVSLGTGQQTPTAASSFALSDIPAAAVRAYQDAGQTCPGLSWTVLAGVGKVETDHARSNLPGVHSGANAAGAMGPMQFLQATWNAFHVLTMNNVYDLRDSAFAAARYLCSNGAGAAARLRQAIWQYNHAWWYVDEVLVWAAKYAADPTATVIVAMARPGDPFAGACGPVVTQGYGPSDLAGEPTLFGFAHFHTGIDLACPSGMPVHTLTDGVAHVTSGWLPGSSVGGGFGNNVVVEVQMQLPGDSGQNRYFVRYAHLLVVTIADRAVVHAGDLIGLEGSTGYSTGPHLHFEVDRGAASVASSVNPAPLLAIATG